MLKNVETSPSKYHKAVHMLVKEMAEVYRFSGKYTQVIKPNSVRDHIRGLEKLVNDIFEGTPHTSLRDNMIYRSYLHDLGEVIGELDVLENAVQKGGITKKDKNKFEEIIFNYFATRAYEISTGISKEPLKNFKFEVEHYRVKLKYALGNTEAMTKLMSELKKQTKVYNDSDLNVLIHDYKEIEVPKQKDYKYFLFKAIDLLEGNLYYVKFGKNGKKVPQEIIDKIVRYANRLCLKLKATTPPVYSLITRAVIAKMEDTLTEYNRMT